MQRAVVNGLRASGIDIVTTAEADRRGLSDPEHLEFATAERRVIFTSNVKDFARIHSQWWQDGRMHAGIVGLVDQQTPPGLQIGALVRLSTDIEPEDMQGRFEFLANWLPRQD